MLYINDVTKAISYTKSLVEYYAEFEPENVFRRCKPIALTLLFTLRNNGVAANLHNGGFTPKTPIKSWDKGWQKERRRMLREDPDSSSLPDCFEHYWVTVGDTILDPSASQFGGEPIATVGDERYMVLDNNLLGIEVQ